MWAALASLSGGICRLAATWPVARLQRLPVRHRTSIEALSGRTGPWIPGILREAGNSSAVNSSLHMHMPGAAAPHTNKLKSTSTTHRPHYAALARPCCMSHPLLCRSPFWQASDTHRPHLWDACHLRPTCATLMCTLELLLVGPTARKDG